MHSCSRVRAVVFDLDGLMFNTEELYQHVGGEILRRRGHEWTQELLDAMMGRPGRVALQIMIERHALDATVEELAAESEVIFESILDTQLEPMPGLLGLLDALEATGIPKAIATSSGRRFTLGVLARYALERRFRFVLTAEDVVEGKPHPEIYLHAASLFGIRSAELVVLEDSANGCRAGVAAGALVVAVPTAQSRAHDFAGARLIAEGLADRRLYQVLGLLPP